MASRKNLDQHAGAPPEIRADGDSVTFHLEVMGVHQHVRFLIRCDAQGEVWASLTPRESPGVGGVSEAPIDRSAAEEIASERRQVRHSERPPLN